MSRVYKFNKGDLTRLFDEEIKVKQKRGPKKMTILKCNTCDVVKTDDIQFKGRMCYECYNVWQRLRYKNKYNYWHKDKWALKGKNKIIDTFENSEQPLDV